MGISKLIFLCLVFASIYILSKRLGLLIKQNKRIEKNIQTVACSQCDTRLAKDKAFKRKGLYFCDQQHAQDYFDHHDNNRN